MTDESERLDEADPSPNKRARPVRATEVTTRGGVKIANFDDIMAVAAVAFKSRMLPNDIKTVEQAFMIVMTGADLGLKPSASFKYLYLTKSRRVALNTKGGLAVVYQSGYCEAYNEWIEGEGEEMRAVASTKRKGMPDTYRKEFSWADAKQAQLLEQRTNREGEEYDSTYDKYLKDMLLSRARGRVLDIAYPDVLGGTPMQGIAEDADAMEAAREGRRRPTPAEDEPAPEGRQITAGGPDPLLEALRKQRAKPEPVPVPAKKAEEPQDAEIVRPAAPVEPEPPPGEEEEEGELFR